jgi:hypothetical protein
MSSAIAGSSSTIRIVPAIELFVIVSE